MCAISDCPLEADRRVRHCHEDESLRWECDMCSVHAKDASARVGTGEVVILGLATGEEAVLGARVGREFEG